MRENQFILRETVRGKEITAEVHPLDFGMQVLVTGGDRSHVGAVCVVDETGKETTVTLPAHKETVIASDWGKTLFQCTGEPVTVTAGIHYDGISRAEIQEVMDVTGNMLQSVMEILKKAEC